MEQQHAWRHVGELHRDYRVKQTRAETCDVFPFLKVWLSAVKRKHREITEFMETGLSYVVSSVTGFPPQWRLGFVCPFWSSLWGTPLVGVQCCAMPLPASCSTGDGGQRGQGRPCCTEGFVVGWLQDRGCCRSWWRVLPSTGSSCSTCELQLMRTPKASFLSGKATSLSFRQQALAGPQRDSRAVSQRIVCALTCVMLTAFCWQSFICHSHNQPDHRPDAMSRWRGCTECWGEGLPGPSDTACLCPSGGEGAGFDWGAVAIGEHE